ncbi:hypothetical protein COEX109129_27555 [Corallococcus exiguus]
MALPGGALLGFCVALRAYDVLALLQAAVQTAHPVCEEKPISPFYIAAELREYSGGMKAALPEEVRITSVQVSLPTLYSVSPSRYPRLKRMFPTSMAARLRGIVSSTIFVCLAMYIR